ncbi:MAG: EAL domain-containing protein [Gammaproteobacteria bacterium]
MNLEKFESYIDGVRTRVTNLHGRAAVLPPEEQNLALFEAIEELGTSLEELQVAQEELRQQNEHLSEAQRLIETERQRYSELFECAPDGYLITDLDGVIREANQAAVQMLNVKPLYIDAKPLITFISRNDRKAFRTQLSRLRFLERTPEEWVMVLHPRRAKPFPAALMVATVRDPLNQPIALRWTVRDTTERKRTEQALQYSEERYRVLYEGTPAIYLSVDMAGNIIGINTFGAESLGYTQDELVGQPLYNIVHEEDRETLARQLQLSLRNPGNTIYAELRKLCKDGSIIWVKETLRVVPDVQGRNVALVVCQDITDIKVAEGKLQRARDDLEVRVKTRTRDLTKANQALQAKIAERKCAQLLLTRQARKLSRAEEASRSQARVLQSVLDNMSEGVIVVDENMTVLLANPAAQQILDTSLVEGANLATFSRDFEFLYPDMKTPCPWQQMPWLRVLRGEKSTAIEVFMRYPQRLHPQWVSVNAKAINDNEGIVRGVVAVFSDITKRKGDEQHLRSLAQYDALTGLPNRNLFRDRLRQAMSRASRTQKMLALMFLDIDHFKDINDTLGHDAGDSVLKAIAERLKDCLREGDTIARLGGDEFTMILEGMEGAEDVAEVAQKILHSLAQPLMLDDQDIFLTTSIGITLYPGDVDDSDNMLKKADIAMYQAKSLGRNNYQFYTAEMTQRASEHLTREGELRHALEHGEMIPYYQPQVDLSSGQIIGVEVLLRWRHPELGLIPCSRFIDLAEKTGLIVPIGDWVLRVACAQTKAWHDAGFGFLRIAVNQSARQFKQPDRVSSIADMLADTGLDAHYLDLEITEELLMENTETSMATCAELRSLGVHIAIDDFGAGYSSLSYLKNFSFDCLKIDQSFIQNIPRNTQDAAIITAIITLAHNLHLRVVAEGVETQEQMAFLHDQGCEGIQGFVFSKPLPADELTALLCDGRCLANSHISSQLRLM